MHLHAELPPPPSDLQFPPASLQSIVGSGHSFPAGADPERSGVKSCKKPTIMVARTNDANIILKVYLIIPPLSPEKRHTSFSGDVNIISPKAFQQLMV